MNLGDAYPWLKGLHVAAAITFVGGVLATTVALSTLSGDGDLSLEQRRMIGGLRLWDARLTTPAMLVVWALGLTLALSAGWFRSGWLPVKLVFVVLTSVVHGMQSGSLRRLAGGKARVRSQQPAALVILVSAALIAVLAVVKPF